MPGSPFATDNISPSVLATLEANYGLDKPIDQQFVIYLQSLLQGNLGVSYTRTGVTVNDLIAQRLPGDAQARPHLLCHRACDRHGDRHLDVHHEIERPSRAG